MTGTTLLPQPINVRMFGEGPRQVLALHCTLAHAGAWRGLAAHLSDVATIHATDMFCHGQSPDWDGQGDFQDRMTEAALAHLTQPMDVVGHSFGATVALRLALERPDLVRSLTIIESVLMAAVWPPESLEKDLSSGDSAPFRAALADGDFALAARLFNRSWGDRSGPKWDQMPEKTRAAMTRGIQIVPHCDAAVLYDRAGVLKPGAIDSIRMPTLLLEGETTAPSISSVHAALADRLPNARRVTVPNAGHMVPITHPGETANHLRKMFETA